MAVFLVPDLRGRSLVLLDADDQQTAQDYAALFLPTSDPTSIGEALDAGDVAGELEWCRMAPITVSA